MSLDDAVFLAMQCADLKQAKIPEFQRLLDVVVIDVVDHAHGAHRPFHNIVNKKAMFVKKNASFFL